MPAVFASGDYFAALFQDLPLTTKSPSLEKKATWFNEAALAQRELPATWFREPEPSLPHKEPSASSPHTSEEPKLPGFRPRTSEEPKLPGLKPLTLLPLKAPLIPSGLEEPAAPFCRNVKRVDSQTVVPGAVFDGMMRLGKEARKRGAHEWTRKAGTRGVLRKANTVSL